jgi:uncharacterized protein (DUF362 family)
MTHLFIAGHRHDDHGYELSAVERSLGPGLVALLTEHLDGQGKPFAPAAPHVVIKPNWVREGDTRPERCDQWEHVITHPAVIWATVRHVDRFLRGCGRITICDAPQTDSSLRTLLARCNFDAYARCHPLEHGTPIAIVDLRREEWTTRNGVVIARHPLPGDPAGYTLVDLGSRSRFASRRMDNIYGAEFDYRFTQRQHSDGHHRYLISATVLRADLVISMPKLKTHKKGGITGALKNMVGVNGDKNYLPHHTFGPPSRGGDEFPEAKRLGSMESQMLRLYKSMVRRLPESVARGVAVPIKKVGRLVFGDTSRVIRSGNWHGNDTVWRMTLDLNAIVRWVDADGSLRRHPRPVLVVTDGVLGGEAEGPMSPDPKAGDVLIVSDDSAVADHAAALWMGFDPARIPSVAHAFNSGHLPLTAARPEDIVVESAEARFRGPLAQVVARHGKSFRPHSGWRGKIERRTQGGHTRAGASATT